jgi:hypothetical protein
MVLRSGIDKGAAPAPFQKISSHQRRYDKFSQKEVLINPPPFFPREP